MSFSLSAQSILLGLTGCFVMIPRFWTDRSRQIVRSTDDPDLNRLRSLQFLSTVCNFNIIIVCIL